MRGYQPIDSAEEDASFDETKLRKIGLVGAFALMLVGCGLAVSVVSSNISDTPMDAASEIGTELTLPLLALSTPEFAWDVDLTKTLYRQAVSYLDAGDCDSFSGMLASDGEVWSPAFRQTGTGESSAKEFCNALVQAQVQIDYSDLYQNAKPEYPTAAVAARLELGASDPPCIQSAVMDLYLTFDHDYSIAKLTAYYDLQELDYDFATFGKCEESSTKCHKKWKKDKLHDLVQDSFDEYCKWNCLDDGFGGYYTKDAILNDPYGELAVGRDTIGQDGCAVLEGDFLALTTLTDGDVIVSCDDKSPLAATSSRYWWQWSGYRNGDEDGDFCVNSFVETGATLIDRDYKIPYQEFVMNATYQGSKFHECQVGHDL